MQRRTRSAAGFQPTPSNLSAPLVAIALEMSLLVGGEEVDAEEPGAAISGQAREVFAGQNITSGGSRETLENDWQVIPTGSPPRHRGHHGDAGGEQAEHVAELARALGGLRVVDRDRRVLAEAELEVEAGAEEGVDQLPAAARSRARPALIPSGISADGSRLGAVIPSPSSRHHCRRSRGPSRRRR